VYGLRSGEEKIFLIGVRGGVCGRRGRSLIIATPDGFVGGKVENERSGSATEATFTDRGGGNGRVSCFSSIALAVLLIQPEGGAR